MPYPQQFRQIFRQLNGKNGITLILVTHDRAVARNARRIIVLRDAAVVEVTTDFARAMKAMRFGEFTEPANE